MKKAILLMTLVIASSIFFSTRAQTNSGNKSKTNNKEKERGEEIFIEQADKCLDKMVKAAQKMEVTGVAFIAFIPGDVTTSWISKMKVVGALTNDSANFLAIANSKASEMADTYKNSGSGLREPLTGEFGWKGGVIKKVNSGYILAAFSGASGEQDVELSQVGVDWLSKYY